ncbi:MAG: M20/M25/M40 family metallo-hydrolase [Phycisphaeraceae bacterium]|nr:M20/M25/M40 family metallo-hydrolase [Phycisphaeraceae bacterium]
MSQHSIPQDVVSLLQSMIQIPSVNSAACGNPTSEKALLEHNQQIAIAMGFEIRHLPVAGRAGNLLVTHQVNDSNRWLMFESHLDTVTEQGMTIDPFAGEIRDHKVWGRGSCDTKGTGAAMLWALHQYKQQSAKPHNIAILFAMDEEYGMTGIRNFVNQHLPTLNMELEGVIVGEPTMCKPIMAHNGCLRVSIQTTGKAVHSSTPHLGRSAISDIVRVIDLLESKYIPNLTATHQMTGKAQASINLISGGVQINIIPDYCEIQMDRRIVPGEDPQQVYDELHEHLQALPDDICWKMDCRFSSPPLPPAGDNRLLEAVQQVLKACDLDTYPLGVPYATDAGDLGSHGIPTLVLGPGDIAQAHTKDEWIDIDQLNLGTNVYLKLMQQH